MSYQPTPEIVLCGLGDADLQIPELTVSYTRASGKMFKGSVTEVEDVADFLKSTFGHDEIELQEQFIVLYLNQKCDIIGYYRHSRGGINSTVADKRLILGAALKCAAVSMVIAHNHPSGNLQPSEADRKLTASLKDAASLMDIRLIDHLILTKGRYLSFAQEGLLGLKGLPGLKPTTAVEPTANAGKATQVPAEHKFHNQHELNCFVEGFLTTRSESDSFTDAEKALLRRYSGSGGQGKHGATGEGVLYEFYTPDWVCDWMWKIAYHYGYDGGTVLEPSCATGELIRPAPDKSKCYGFEINPTSRKIARILYPQANIREGYFETSMLEPPRFTTRLKKSVTWLEGYPFSLVIGNPPYGRYTNAYSTYFPKPKMKQIELFFYYHGLRMLKQGGLLIYLAGSNVLRNGYTYNDEKRAMQDLGCELLDAYRLPPVFAFSEVPTDILVLRKK